MLAYYTNNRITRKEYLHFMPTHGHTMSNIITHISIAVKIIIKLKLFDDRFHVITIGIGYVRAINVKYTF